MQSDFAIVIGIARYPDLLDSPGAADLEAPVGDAKAIFNWLVDPAGGDVPPKNIQLITTDDAAEDNRPTQEQIHDAFQRIHRISLKNQEEMLGRKVGRRLYLYMSGHGFSPDTQKAALYTANATLNFPININASGWLNWFQDNGYFDESVLWMDCCMNLESGAVPGPVFMQRGGTFAAGPACVCFAATRPLKAVERPIPEDGGKLHGVFTWTLLQGLKGGAVDPQGRITGRSLGDYLDGGMQSFLTAQDRLLTRVISQRPEIVRNSPDLIFATNVTRRELPVTLRFPAITVGRKARLWSGIPAQSTTFDIDGVQVVRQVGVGLHLVDIPELAIRQGFEVVANENVVIDVIAAGEPVQLPVASDAVFLLSVRPTNPAAQIFIVNQQLSQLHESRRFFASGLGFGLYKVKVRLARDTTERIQLLDADTDVDFVDRLPDPQVPSPPTPLPTLEMPAMRPMMAPVRQAAILQPRMGTAVPFQNSFQATQQHTQAFEELTAPRMQLEGMQLEAPSAQGVAEIKIMARVWSASLWGDSAFELPWKKTTLYNSKGTPLLCLGDLTVGSESDEPFVSTTLSVSPGTYYLKHHMRNGRIVEHCLHVPRNWSVRAFMLASEAGTPTLPSHRQLATRPPQLDHFTFLMERSGSRGISELDEVIEAARIALIDQRSILSDELEELLMGKNENPIAGIIGAHLLIMEADNVAGAGNTAIPSRLAALDTVVGNLRRLVGDKHPDVEALSLRCPDPGLRTTTSTFTRPPMYARSWKLIMEGVASNPALISDSLWKRVSASLSTSGLLLWAKDKATKNNHEKQLKSWVTSMCMTAASDITGDDIAHMAGEISVPAKVVQEIWEQL